MTIQSQNGSSFISNPGDSSSAAFEGGFTSVGLDATLTLGPSAGATRTIDTGTDWSEQFDSHGRTIKMRLIVDGQGQPWSEIQGPDGYYHQERELASRDGGPAWVETDFGDVFGREIVRQIPSIDGQGSWTETFNAKDGIIARCRFGVDGSYYREAMQAGKVQRTRSWSVGTTHFSEDVTDRSMPGLPALCLSGSVAPLVP